METPSPDVGAFQEVVVRCDGLDQGALLLGDNGYLCVFGAAFRWNDEGAILAHDGEGNAFGNLDRLTLAHPLERGAARAREAR